MPNIKASKKDVKVTAKRTVSNNNYTAKMKNYIRKCDKAIDAGNKEEAKLLLAKVQQTIDKAASKGLIKKNSANRQKTRLSGKVKNLK